MLKLIKLEWKKNHIGKYVCNAIILAGVLGLFIFALAFLGIANDPDTGVPDAAPGNDIISAPIELFTSMSFLIFTSVMLASFIVSSYKNKTMNLMFSYPIKRQKILVSQMLAVWIFNFISLFIGMAMKSSKATIISSFLLILLTQANVGDFTIKDNMVFPIILTLISLLFAVLSAYHAETKDLM